MRATVTVAGSAARLKPPSGPHERAERLAEVVARRARQLGDFLDAQRARAAMAGDREQGAEGVVGGQGEHRRVGGGFSTSTC
jgi:hypothetical protein